jgi:phage repressor protein C with HTH and peptisase S24 domain
MSKNNTRVLKKINTQVVCNTTTPVLNSYGMRMSYADRLRTARKRKGLSQKKLEEISGVGQGTISKIERGGQGNSASDVDLAMALDIHPAWLTNGDERYAPAWLLTPDQSTPLKITEPENNYRSMQLRHAPVVGMAQLGDKGYWCDMDYPQGFGDGYIPWPSRDKDIYAVRCVGDSMRPRIRHGEFVIVEPNREARPGDEVLIKSHDGRVMVKIFMYKRDGHYYFESVNDAHPSISIPNSEIAALHYVEAIVKSSSWIKY